MVTEFNSQTRLISAFDGHTNWQRLGSSLSKRRCVIKYGANAKYPQVLVSPDLIACFLAFPFR
jgi:hypothetical protein